MSLSGAIVGLGNPTPEYAHTRHNQGFDVITLLLKEANLTGSVRSINGAKFNCELWQVEADFLNGTWLCAKPLTFMNLSGKCVQPLLAFYKLKPNNLIVLHDELDIKAGELRFKYSGGNAGHNG